MGRDLSYKEIESFDTFVILHDSISLSSSLLKMVGHAEVNMSVTNNLSSMIFTFFTGGKRVK